MSRARDNANLGAQAGSGLDASDITTGVLPSGVTGGSGLNALSASNLSAGVVPDARMPNLTGAITTVEGAVATTIANDAVDSQHYAAGSIDNEHLADDAVGTDELANNVVISTSGAITTTGAFTSIGIDDNANALAMTIDVSENVGIGTTAPISPLSIKRLPLNNLNAASHHLNIGSDSSGNNLYWSIGFGYYSLSGSHQPAYIGYKQVAGLDNSKGDLIFGTRGNEEDVVPTERMQIASAGDVTVSTGNLVIPTANKGINFTGGTDPDTSGTATGNILDDFEEGTWTPLDTDSSGSTQYGMYTKIGNLVTISFHFTTSAGLAGSDTFYLRGFPFTNGSTDAFRGAVSIGYTSADYFVHQGYVSTGNTIAYMMQGTTSIATDDQIGGNIVLTGSAVYRVP